MVFLLYSHKSSLNILDNSPSEVSFSDCFPSLGLSSHSLDIVIHRVEVFSFNKVQLINYFFKKNHAFAVISKKSSSCPGSWKLSPILSSRRFPILCFTFSYMMHLLSIFLKDERSVSIFVFCICMSSCSRTIY